MTKNCKTCAWYCHSDRHCYGFMGKVHGEPMPVSKNWTCGKWTFDGLEEWEREETEALMTMEPA